MFRWVKIKWNSLPKLHLSPKKKRLFIGSLVTLFLATGLVIGINLAGKIQNIQQKAASVSGIEAINLIKSRISNDIASSLSDSDRIRAGENLSTMKADGSWEGINIKALDGAGVYQHTTKIFEIAKVYKEQNNPEWLAKIKLSMSYANREMTNLLGNSRPGWSWHLDVGIVDYSYGPLLIILEKDLDPKMYNESVLLVQKLVDFDSDVDHWENQQKGANKTWRGMAKFYLGLVSNNETSLLSGKKWVTDGLSSYPTSFLPREKVNPVFLNGIMPDYSYLFHNGALQTGAYGMHDPYFAGFYNVLTEGTSYQLDQQVIQQQQSYILDGLRWIYFKGNKDIFASGRETSRNYLSSNRNNQRETNLLTLVNHFRLTSNQNTKTALAGTLKNWLKYVSPSEYSNLGYHNLLEEVSNTNYPETPLEGHKYYPYADYTIHRTKDYYFSLKNVSSRTMAFEATNGEGLKNWFFSDGAIYLSFSGKEFINDNNILPTYDWTRLPGTTVEQKLRLPDEGNGHFGEKNFVGGLTFDNSGISAMDFKAFNSCLTAKKSWFFFKNEIVALGSNINCQSSNPVETIINQWPIADNPSTTLLVNGSQMPDTVGWTKNMNKTTWIHHNNIGYYFPTPQKVQVSKTNQSGSWKELGNQTAGADYVHTNPFLKLTLNHGPNPKNATYAYVLLPLLTAQETQTYASNNQLQILSNDASAHAVYQKNQGSLGIVFWNTQKRINGVSVNKPAIVFIQYGNNNKVSIIVSDPTSLSSQIEVSMVGRFSLTDTPSNNSSSTTETTSNENSDFSGKKIKQTKVIVSLTNGLSSVIELVRKD